MARAGAASDATSARHRCGESELSFSVPRVFINPALLRVWYHMRANPHKCTLVCAHTHTLTRHPHACTLAVAPTVSSAAHLPCMHPVPRYPPLDRVAACDDCPSQAKAAHVLVARHKLGPRSRVLFHMPTCVEQMVWVLACQRVGIMYTCTSVEHPVDAITYRIVDVKPDLFVCGDCSCQHGGREVFCNRTLERACSEKSSIFEVRACVRACVRAASLACRLSLLVEFVRHCCVALSSRVALMFTKRSRPLRSSTVPFIPFSSSRTCCVHVRVRTSIVSIGRREGVHQGSLHA
jgi:hypothetical protein